jgi:uncharacterized protein Smg (DUF494 family)
MSGDTSHEAVFRALRLVADQLERYVDGDELAFETLGEALEQAGLSPDDLQSAVMVLRSISTADGEPDGDDDPAPGQHAHRVLSPEERAILAPEAWGYLLWLRKEGSLDAAQFERVLDLVSGSGVRPVGVEHVREAAVRVAMTPGPADLDERTGEGPFERAH